MIPHAPLAAAGARTRGCLELFGEGEGAELCRGVAAEAWPRVEFRGGGAPRGRDGAARGGRGARSPSWRGAGAPGAGRCPWPVLPPGMRGPALLEDAENEEDVSGRRRVGERAGDLRRALLLRLSPVHRSPAGAAFAGRGPGRRPEPAALARLQHPAALPAPPPCPRCRFPAPAGSPRRLRPRPQLGGSGPALPREPARREIQPGASRRLCSDPAPPAPELPTKMLKCTDGTGGWGSLAGAGHGRWEWVVGSVSLPVAGDRCPVSCGTHLPRSAFLALARLPSSPF